jgi:hypothetical protein
VHHQASHDSMIFIFSLSLLDIYPPHWCPILLESHFCLHTCQHPS